MSLHPQPIEDIPALTVEVARAAFPQGNPYMTLRDEFGRLFTDEQCADLFPPRGQPAMAPWQLALMTLMQFAEDLTDRQAAEQVRGRIDWKDALGLDLREAGFDFSGLREFRSRLVAGAAETRLLDQVLAHAQARGWRKAGGRQRTDSTHVLAAVRRLTRLEVVGETLPHALNVLAQVDPVWVQQQAQPEWWSRYGQRFCEYHFPADKDKQETLAQLIGHEGSYLLTQLDGAAAPPYLRTLPAIQIVRQVWIQQFYQEAGMVQWRDAKHIPPAAVMIASPYDTDVRLSQKRSQRWQGYNVHLTETCEPTAPHLITHVETTLATRQDNTALPSIHEQLQAKGVVPSEHLVDSGYPSATNLVDSQSEYGIELLGPMRPDGSWQARDDEAYDRSQFSIDWENQIVICPQGQTSRYWKDAQGSRDYPIIQVVFDKKTCLACAVRSYCTRSESAPRYLSFHHQAQQEALRAARAYQQTDEFRERYKKRAGVEGTIAQAAFTFGMRRTRYRGLAKTHLQHVATAAAINLSRIVNWLDGKKPAATPISPFARLAPAA